MLDLRDNGGGLLDAAIGILNELVPQNSLLVITKGKRSDSERKFFSKEDPILPADVPLAVLINNKTASASEIVAGAVQDLNRSVGTKSFGKGLVQQIKDLDKKSQIKITGSRYFTPSVDRFRKKIISRKTNTVYSWIMTSMIRMNLKHSTEGS